MFSNRALWVGQVVMGVYFVAVGVTHFVVPDGLPEQMAWMYELSDTLHYASGTAEILGGLGLILPGLTGIQPRLTVAAAVGLIAVMAGAMFWHLTSGEGTFAQNIVLMVPLAWIAYGRAQRTPLAASSDAATV